MSILKDTTCAKGKARHDMDSEGCKDENDLGRLGGPIKEACDHKSIVDSRESVVFGGEYCCEGDDACIQTVKAQETRKDIRRIAMGGLQERQDRGKK